MGGVASMWGTLAVCTTGGSPASHRPSHPIFTVPPPLAPLVIRPPRSGGVPAMLKVAQDLGIEVPEVKSPEPPKNEKAAEVELPEPPKDKQAAEAKVRRTGWVWVTHGYLWR